MTTTVLPTVLCVDDEPQVLAGLSLHLRRKYHVLTATSGAEGLAMLATHPDTAVVLSDMRMPVMDGATLLSRAREVAPNAVRMLLTGHSEMDAAAAAVNQGQIFRFLTKPCPSPVLVASMQDAVSQHRLLLAETVLLEQTLPRVVTTLTDVLALTSPVLFGRASRVKAIVTALSRALQLPDAWEFEVAAMLSHLGYIALSTVTAEKVYLGQPLSEEESQELASVPALTERLLASIPRLEVVRGILADSAPDAGESLLTARIRQGADLLKAAGDFDRLETESGAWSVALDGMRRRASEYGPLVLPALEILKAQETAEPVREVFLADLEVGMVFADDVRTADNSLLVARGLEVTAGVIAWMRSTRRGAVNEPVRVCVRAAPDGRFSPDRAPVGPAQFS